MFGSGTFSVRTAPFWVVHVLAIAGVAFMGWSWSGLLLAVGIYYLRMFGITAGYHRYFAHRSFKTSRPIQFVLALLGTLAVQKGVLWWAAHHRWHHRFSDTERDLHSPRRSGFLWAHVGWFLSPKYDATDYTKIRDFVRYPELRWLNDFYLVPPIAGAFLLYLFGGAHAFLWGGLVSTVALWHGTFFINSLAHVIGRRRYATSDDSRNSAILALLTMGEGWHNNHHFYQSSANQGFRWYELDMSYLLLRLMSAIGLVWGLRTPPVDVVEAPDADAAATAEDSRRRRMRSRSRGRAVPAPTRRAG